MESPLEKALEQLEPRLQSWIKQCASMEDEQQDWEQFALDGVLQIHEWVQEIQELDLESLIASLETRTHHLRAETQRWFRGLQQSPPSRLELFAKYYNLWKQEEQELAALRQEAKQCFTLLGILQFTDSEEIEIDELEILTEQYEMLQGKFEEVEREIRLGAVILSDLENTLEFPSEIPSALLALSEWLQVGLPLVEEWLCERLVGRSFFSFSASCGAEEGFSAILSHLGSDLEKTKRIVEIKKALIAVSDTGEELSLFKEKKHALEQLLLSQEGLSWQRGQDVRAYWEWADQQDALGAYLSQQGFSTAWKIFKNAEMNSCNEIRDYLQQQKGEALPWHFLHLARLAEELKSS